MADPTRPDDKSATAKKKGHLTPDEVIDAMSSPQKLETLMKTKGVTKEDIIKEAEEVAKNLVSGASKISRV